ncbi:MAG TPA: TIGR04255 family protein [Croceibacterium sp.]
MTDVHRYPSPPIIDAIIELRLRDTVSEGLLTKAAKAVAKNYAHHVVEQEVDVSVRFDPNGVSPEIGEPRGLHRLSSADETDRAQVSTKIFNWSRLPPYECWEDLENRFVRDLERIERALKKLPRFERFGVRYRNRIDVPVGDDRVGRYEDYLNVKLDLLPMLDPLNAYQWRIDKDFADRGLSAIVQSGTLRPELPMTTPVLLDIDIAATKDLPIGQDKIVERLRDMRLLKNEIFEASITPLARQSFK